MSDLTEKQKMLQGLEYFPSDKSLQQDRADAKRLCQQFNHCDIDDRKGGRKIIKSLFGQCAGAWIEPNFYCDYGYNITTGKNFYANHGLVGFVRTWWYPNAYRRSEGSTSGRLKINCLFRVRDS